MDETIKSEKRQMSFIDKNIKENDKGTDKMGD